MGFIGFSNVLIWAGLLLGLEHEMGRIYVNGFWKKKKKKTKLEGKNKNKKGEIIGKSKTRNYYQIKEASSANTNSFPRSLAALEKQLPPR